MPQVKSQAIWGELRRLIETNNAARSKPQPSKYSKQPPRYPSSKWTDLRVELLKKLWADGLSATQIATKIGEVTRNSVIGKVHRLGLGGRATTSRIRTARPRLVSMRASILLKAQKPPKDALIRARAPNRITTPVLDETAPGNLKLTDLTETMCHWPVGDPREQGFHFCARRKSFGAPYCEHHAAIAYNPAARRARRAA